MEYDNVYVNNVHVIWDLIKNLKIFLGTKIIVQD